ncbi:phospholipase D family protein [Frigoribacterium sp. 2-23]|uniref:phospholipase D family protein n=1 Tax=Frigoribacterium sp. 2-23 TaxID=3415006 RepID=UPI003C6FF2EB
MKMRFVGQPFAEHTNLADFIEHARDQHFDEIRIAVAWAKRSGLGRVWDALDQFRTQGGTVILIVGVSEGGATREGLELAIKAADQAFVFHDPRRTFHPKVYYASSVARRALLVGSSNLTAGGLGWNYEASVWAEWDADEGADVTNQVGKWFETLVAASDSCRPLTAELIDELERSSDITLGSETGARRVQKKTSDTPEDNDSVAIATVSGLFRSIVTGLRKLPRLSPQISPQPAPVITIPSQPETASGLAKSPSLAGLAPFPTEDVQRRWVKQLDNTAAQQVKSANSNPTGNLRLSREDAAIDHKIYFREDFFGGLPWAPVDGRPTEQEVIVSFRTWIDGQDLGPQELRISHDPRRIAGQGNVPTLLHWGVLGPILRDTNYVGLYVSIERTSGGGYNLVIAQAPRGDYQV